MTSRDELQRRIEAALTESPDDRRRSSFSEFADSPNELVTALYRCGSVEGALDEFDRLLGSGEDRVRLQWALSQFLTHHPAAHQAGVRVPDLERVAPWKVLPSKRK